MARKLQGIVGAAGLAVGLVAAAGAASPAYAGVDGHKAHVNIHKTWIFAPHFTDIDVRKNIFAPHTDVDFRNTTTTGTATSVANGCKLHGIFVDNHVHCDVSSKAEVTQIGNGDHNFDVEHKHGHSHGYAADPTMVEPEAQTAPAVVAPAAQPAEAVVAPAAQTAPAVVAPEAQSQPAMSEPMHVRPAYAEPVYEGRHHHRHGVDVDSDATGILNAHDSNGLNIGGIGVSIPITIACNAVNVIGFGADADC
jgi:hypothetical protein